MHLLIINFKEVLLAIAFIRSRWNYIRTGQAVRTFPLLFGHFLDWLWYRIDRLFECISKVI